MRTLASQAIVWQRIAVSLMLLGGLAASAQKPTQARTGYGSFPPPDYRAAAPALKVLAESTFKTSREDWVVEGVSETALPKWNADGSISYSVAEPGKWLFSAPAKFIHDKAAAYGGRFRFRWRASARHAPSERPGVFLAAEHPDGRRDILQYRIDGAPAQSWSTVVVPLVEAGWRTDLGRPVTRRQLLCALRHLKLLSISYAAGDAEGRTFFLSQVVLEGVKGKPRAACTPPPKSGLDFGLVSIGEPKELPLRIRNKGNVPLRVAFDNPTPFSVTPQSDEFCGAIAPGDTEVFRVKYSPSGVGRHNRTLEITTNQRGRRKRIRYRLTGRGKGGAEAQVVADPKVLSFGEVIPGGAGKVLSFELKNVGGAGTQVLVNAPQAPFSTIERIVNLPPGGSARQEVTFAPGPASLPTDYPGEIKVTDARGRTVATVTLNGRGGLTNPTGVKADPATLNFPDVEYLPGAGRDQRLDFKLTHQSNRFVQFYLESTEGFQVYPRPGGSPAGRPISITVTFRPGRLGSHTGEVRIMEDEDGRRSKVLARVRLRGEAVAPPDR